MKSVVWPIDYGEYGLFGISHTVYGYLLVPTSYLLLSSASDGFKPWCCMATLNSSGQILPSLFESNNLNISRISSRSSSFNPTGWPFASGADFDINSNLKKIIICGHSVVVIWCPCPSLSKISGEKKSLFCSLNSNLFSGWEIQSSPLGRI